MTVEKVELEESELGGDSPYVATGVTVINKNGYREQIRARHEVILAGEIAKAVTCSFFFLFFWK